MGIQQYVNRDFKLSDSRFVSGDTKIAAEAMYKYIEENKIKKERLHIDSMKHDVRRSSLTPICMAEHRIRIQNADTSHPIVINFDGSIMDGFHRPTKAIINQDKYIDAYRVTRSDIPSSSQ